MTSIGSRVAAKEKYRGKDEVGGDVRSRHLVEVQFEREGRLPEQECSHAQRNHAHGGSVDQRQQPVPVPAAQALLGKDQSEVQKERRLQCVCDDVAPEDRPVQKVEPARVVKGVEDERGQAEDVEVRSARRRPAAEQDVYPDGQVDQADHAGQVGQCAIRWDRNDRDRRVQRDAAADDFVVGLTEDACVLEFSIEIGADFDSFVIDRCKQIARFNTGLRSRAA